MTWWRIIGLGVAAALALSACSGTNSPAPTPTDTKTESPTGNSGTASGTPTPSQSFEPPEAVISWQECGKYECGTLVVPADYEGSTSQTFELSVKKLPARRGSDRLGSLVINPGGPGGSGVDFLDQAAAMFGDDLLDRFDIVGFDPRGVGKSSPAVSCITDAQVDAARAASYDLETSAGLAQLQQEADDFAANCLTHTGAGLAFIDTISAAEDLDMLRRALGESKLDYLGFSYGTLLGATYADLFPQNVGRFVLDGALDPTLTYEELGQGQARGFEQALRAYVADCQRRMLCPLDGGVDDGVRQIQAFIDQLREKPLPTLSGRELTAQLGANGVIVALYSDESWPYLTVALELAMDSNLGDGLLLLADLGARRGTDGKYESNSYQAFTAINCLDYAPDADVAAMRADAAVLDQLSPTFGQWLAYGGVTCAKWPFEPRRAPAELRAAGAPPIVVIGTTGDPATPHQWAIALADQLESAVLVTLEGYVHTAYGGRSTCIDSAVEQFLVAGEVPEDGLVCGH